MCAIRGERIAMRHWMHSECAILPKDPHVAAATGMLVDTIRWSLVYVLLEYLQPGSYRLAAAEAAGARKGSALP